MKNKISKAGSAFILLASLISCGKKPSANFTWSPVSPKAGQTVTFTNTSKDAKKYSWNFGDMSIGEDQNPSHTYSAAGNYIVELTAHKGMSSDSKTYTVTVAP